MVFWLRKRWIKRRLETKLGGFIFTTRKTDNGMRISALALVFLKRSTPSKSSLHDLERTASFSAADLYTLSLTSSFPLAWTTVSAMKLGIVFFSSLETNDSNLRLDRTCILERSWLSASSSVLPAGLNALQ